MCKMTHAKTKYSTTAQEPSLSENIWSHVLTADRLAQLVEHRTAVQMVAGSNLDRTNTQGLKITEEKVLPL